MNVAKFFRTAILQNAIEWLLLNLESKVINRLTIGILEVAPTAFYFISSYQKSERNSKYFFPFHYRKNVLETKLKILSASLKNIWCGTSHLTHFKLMFDFYTFGFLKFSVVIEVEHRLKMG